MLVIPAYIYHWQPIKEIVILGELLAISAVIMCLLFVTVDIGRPDRFWHLMPFIGALNFPRALLAWDVLVLNLYLALNVVIVAYLLYSAFHGPDAEPVVRLAAGHLLHPVRGQHPHRDGVHL